jgi:hypothetical protein
MVGRKIKKILIGIKDILILKHVLHKPSPLITSVKTIFVKKVKGGALGFGMHRGGGNIHFD